MIHGHQAIADLLIAADAASRPPSQPTAASTALIYAADYGHEAIVRSVIHKGADFNTRDAGGRTPLYRAAAHGHENITKMLLDAGSNMYLPDYEVMKLKLSHYYPPNSLTLGGEHGSSPRRSLWTRVNSTGTR